MNKLTDAEKEQIENFEIVFRNGGMCVNKTLIGLVEDILQEHTKEPQSALARVKGITIDEIKYIITNWGDMTVTLNEIGKAIKKLIADKIDGR